MEKPSYLSGQVLLAMPGMSDPRFDHAVIAMCGHDADGAAGVGIGATIAGLSLHDVLRQFEIDTATAPNAPVHFGGPVEVRRGFVLHSADWVGQDTRAVTAQWSLSGTIDILRAIADRAGPRRWLVALGYAGWGAGQLDAELAGPGWFNVPADPDLLFETDAPDRWATAFESAGVDPRMLSAGIGTA